MWGRRKRATRNRRRACTSWHPPPTLACPCRRPPRRLAPAAPAAPVVTAPAAEHPPATPAQVYGWLLRAPCKAAAFATASQMALGLPPQWAVISSLFSAAYIIYTADRMKVTPGDEATRGPRVRFMRRHSTALKASLAGAGAVLAVSVVQLPAAAALGLLPLAGIALLYATPLPFLGGHSMRTAPAGKTIVACSIWAAGCVALPVAAAQGGVAAGPLAAMLLHTFTLALNK